MKTKEGLSVVCLNIQGNENLIPVSGFLKSQECDAVLAQEVFKKGARYLGQVLRMNYVFAPTCVRADDFKNGDLDEWGVAIFSPYPIVNSRVEYYGGNSNDLPLLTLGPKGEPLVTAARVFVGGTIEEFNVGTTHGAWTTEGSASDQQREDSEKLLRQLEATQNIFIAGDFNAPRGGEIHSGLVTRGGFRYWIPNSVTTTIDGQRHRAGKLELVVDHAFTRGGYTVEQLEVIDGKSDHLAIKARVHKEQHQNGVYRY